MGLRVTVDVHIISFKLHMMQIIS